MVGKGALVPTSSSIPPNVETPHGVPRGASPNRERHPRLESPPPAGRRIDRGDFDSGLSRAGILFGAMNAGPNRRSLSAILLTLALFASPTLAARHPEETPASLQLPKVHDLPL